MSSGLLRSIMKAEEAGSPPAADAGGFIAEVSLVGFLRDVASRPRVMVELRSGASLGDLLEELVGSEGEGLRHRLLTLEGTLQPGVQVFAGYDQIQELPTRLPDLGASRVKILVLQAGAGG